MNSPRAAGLPCAAAMRGRQAGATRRRASPSVSTWGRPRGREASSASRPRVHWKTRAAGRSGRARDGGRVGRSCAWAPHVWPRQRRPAPVCQSGSGPAGDAARPAAALEELGWGPRWPPMRVSLLSAQAPGRSGRAAARTSGVTSVSTSRSRREAQGQEGGSVLFGSRRFRRLSRAPQPKCDALCRDCYRLCKVALVRLGRSQETVVRMRLIAALLATAAAAASASGMAHAVEDGREALVGAAFSSSPDFTVGPGLHLGRPPTSAGPPASPPPATSPVAALMRWTTGEVASFSSEDLAYLDTVRVSTLAYDPQQGRALMRPGDHGQAPPGRGAMTSPMCANGLGGQRQREPPQPRTSPRRWASASPRAAAAAPEPALVRMARGRRNFTGKRRAALRQLRRLPRAGDEKA